MNTVLCPSLVARDHGKAGVAETRKACSVIVASAWDKESASSAALNARDDDVLGVVLGEAPEHNLVGQVDRAVKDARSR